MDDLMALLNEIFRDVFEDDELHVTRETTAQDVEGWDSLMHVTLIVNVEKAFGVRFSSAAVASLKNVGELADLVVSRTAAKSLFESAKGSNMSSVLAPNLEETTR
jgi:acyl carrier protein